jgi:N-acetylglutamate synthase
MSLDLLRAIEFAAVRGWPALEQSEIDGWVWRYASGGSIRANTVAALTWRGTDIDRTIAACETMYRAKGAPCVFTVSDVSAPLDLDARLEARGYARGQDHATMAKAVSPETPWPDDAGASAKPTEAWMATYLTGLSEDRRGVARQLIANLPDDAQFVSVSPEHDQQCSVASTGLTIVDGPLASVQCMATLPAHRRRGGAWHVLAAIEALAQRRGATHLYLQTGGDNLGAQALYAKYGFSIVGRYHTRTL